MVYSGFSTESPTVKAGNSAYIPDQFGQILSEAADYFKDNGVHIIQNTQDIYGDDQVFAEYSNRLCEGTLPGDSEQIQALMDNHRIKILKESSVANIEPITSLSMPHIRKLWYKTAIRSIVPTEVAKVPVFGLDLLRPYVEDSDGNRYYLPEGYTQENWEQIAGKTRLYEDWIPLEAPVSGGLENFFADGVFNIMEKTGGTKKMRDSIDAKFRIVKVKLKTPDMSAPIEKTVSIETNISDGINGFVEFTDEKGVTHKEQIFGLVDRVEGTIALTCLHGYLQAYQVRGYLSSENNRRSSSVSFDNYHKDIKIGVGPHKNAPLQIEWLQDNMALYNIDAASEVVDIMSEVTAQELDFEGFQFMNDTFIENDYKQLSKFSARPANYASTTPSEWKKELTQVIERVATKLKSFYKFNKGSFVIYGNPIDMLLLQDIVWDFNHNNTQRGGVNVNYDTGAMTVNNSYKLVSVETITPGFIDMIMVPNTDDYMTFKYYPYTFNIEKGTYRDPNNELVPAIMMTKRHIFEKLVPIQARIQILNNDESMYEPYL